MEIEAIRAADTGADFSGERAALRTFIDSHAAKWLPAEWQRLAQQWSLHGVRSLAYGTGTRMGWPAELEYALRARAILRTAWELRHFAVLRGTLDAFNRAGLPVLLLKGTALAYSIYPEPAWRERGDTDVLVAEPDRRRAEDVLIACGFEARMAIDGDFVSYQRSFVKCTADGTEHVVDLHWRLSNSRVLANLFDFPELMRSSIPIPGIGEHARGLSHAHAMLWACVHRAAHATHPYYVDDVPSLNADRLIWLIDVWLLARSMSDQEWRILCGLAQAKCLARICLDTLDAASRTRLEPVAPTFARAHLERAARRREHPAIYLRAALWRQHTMDWLALPGVPARWRYLRENLWPSPAYMRWRYGPSRTLPWLYLRRIAGGVGRYFHQSDAHERGPE